MEPPPLPVAWKERRANHGLVLKTCIQRGHTSLPCTSASRPKGITWHAQPQGGGVLETYHAPGRRAGKLDEWHNCLPQMHRGALSVWKHQGRLLAGGGAKTRIDAIYNGKRILSLPLLLFKIEEQQRKNNTYTFFSSSLGREVTFIINLSHAGHFSNLLVPVTEPL